LVGFWVASLLLATAASADAQLSRTPQEDRLVLSGAWKLDPQRSDDPTTMRSGGPQGKPQGAPGGGGRGRGGIGRGGGMGGDRGVPGEMGQTPNEKDGTREQALASADGGTRHTRHLLKPLSVQMKQVFVDSALETVNSQLRNPQRPSRTTGVSATRSLRGGVEFGSWELEVGN
jgi:hypothetical protein